MEKRIFLQGKLRAPMLASEIITRERLYAVVDASLNKACVNVIAPAGFGKSTLIANWAKDKSIDAVWLTVEDTDNQSSTFWSALVIACAEQGFHTPTAKELMCCFSDEIGSEAWVNEFFNELTEQSKGTGKQIALVIDDMHHINNPAIISSLARVIRFLPESLTFFFLSRSQLPKGLVAHIPASLLSTIDANDLVFNYEDCDQFLQATKSEGLFDSDTSLSRESYNAIKKVAEGWPLITCQLLKRWANSEGELSFSHIVNADESVKHYIDCQIIESLDDDLVHSLVALSSFSHFNKSLYTQCLFPNAETSSFEKLVSCQGLITSITNSEGNYRIRQPLRNRLISLAESERFGKSCDHFKNAYQWYVANESVYEAISLCFDFGYWQSGIHLIESKYRALVKGGRWTEIARWLDVLPNHVIQQRPLIVMLQAWGALFGCMPLKAIVYLNQVDKMLSDDAKRIDHPDCVYNQLGKQTIRCEAAQLLEWVQAVYMNNSQHTLSHALDKYGPMSTNSVVLRYLQGVASLYNNQLENAILQLDAVIQQALAEGHQSVFFQAIGYLGWAHYLAGDIAAWQTKVSALKERVARDFTTSHPDTAWLSAAIVMTQIEKAVINFNTEGFAKFEALYNQSTSLDSQYNLLLISACYYTQQGKFKKAENVLSEAEIIACELPPIVHQSFFSVPALKAELNLKQGKREEALFWAESVKNKAEKDSLFYQHERLVCADVMLSLGQASESIALARQIKEWSHLSEHRLLQLRVNIIEALALQHQKTETKARDVFADAILVGKAMGSVHSFVRPEPEMIELLAVAKTNARFPSYVGKLVEAVSDKTECEDRNEAGLEVLSKRELQVLELMATGISNPQIAESLCRSLGTVKIHVHNIYRKLGVTNRVTAINKYMMSNSSFAA